MLSRISCNWVRYVSVSDAACCLARVLVRLREEEDEASRSESEGASGKEIIEMMKGNDPIQKADRRGRELGK